MCVYVRVCVRVLAGRETGPYEALAPKREGEAAKAQLFITPAGQQPVTTAVTTPKTGTQHIDYYLGQIYTAWHRELKKRKSVR